MAAGPQCKKRLEIEEKKLKADPPEFIKASPDPANIMIWYYCITGPPGTPYEGGQYVGTVTFPPAYPFAPPGIRMITPSGRFEVNARLCLSISDYHPELWNPIWGMSSILVGLLSFMMGDESTTGSITSTVAAKTRCAAESHARNLKIAKFVDIFPEEAAKAQALVSKVLESTASQKISKKRAREE
jgi:ubiquitin-conjugating enzyme E2 J2